MKWPNFTSISSLLHCEYELKADVTKTDKVSCHLSPDPPPSRGGRSVLVYRSKREEDPVCLIFLSPLISLRKLTLSYHFTRLAPGLGAWLRNEAVALMNVGRQHSDELRLIVCRTSSPSLTRMLPCRPRHTDEVRGQSSCVMTLGDLGKTSFCIVCN